ncbi:MAG: hypothetical protein AABX82_04745 [Nanoarchaeota archaeon]
MTRQIDFQYWKHHSPEQLVKREEAVIREGAFGSDKPYKVHFYEAVLQRYENVQQAIQECKRLREKTLVEALGTLTSGGLELALRTDENDTVSENQLLSFVNPATRKRYQHAKKTAERLCEVYNLLRERYASL